MGERMDGWKNGEWERRLVNHAGGRMTRWRGRTLGRGRQAAWLLVLLMLGSSSAWAQPEVPDLTGRVVDTADLLSPQTERVLTAKLRAHEDSTGNQVAVLTIPSLQGAVLEDYSLRVARTWALGQEEFDNGVLLLVARDDREMRIEVGYGLEGALPDVIASRIIRYEITPRFRDGDFDGGVRAGVDAILGAIDGTYTPPDPDASSSRRPVGLFMTVFGVLFGGMPAYITLKAAARSGWVAWIAFLVLLSPFSGIGAVIFALGTGYVLFGGGPLSAATTLSVLIGLGIAFLWASIHLIRHPKLRRLREKAEDEEPIDETVDLGWITFAPSFWTASAIRSTGSSGSGSSFSSGGFSSGGGGFSGGGGSFGGGGASGGW